MTAARTGNAGGRRSRLLARRRRRERARTRARRDRPDVGGGGKPRAAVKVLVAARRRRQCALAADDFPEVQFGDGTWPGLTILPRGGWTPLMYAARQGASPPRAALAEAGADLNLTDPDGTTALVLAIINRTSTSPALLMDKGADPERRRRRRAWPRSTPPST